MSYKPGDFLKCDIGTRAELEAALADRSIIGKTVLVSRGRRIYPSNGKGMCLSRGCYERETITGQTRVSWLTLPDWSPGKIPKRKALECMFSNECADRAAWVSDHGYALCKKIDDLVRGDKANGYEILHRICPELGIELPGMDHEAEALKS